jgi:multiple sugar transport system permease protein
MATHVTGPTPVPPRATAPESGDALSPRVGRPGVAATGLLMVVFAAYFLVPLWWLLVASSKTLGELTTTPGLWFGSGFHLFSNIGDVFSYNDGVFLRWFLNSLLYAALGAAGATVIAAMAGYALAKYVFPGREVVFNAILAGVLVPTTALALPLFLIAVKAGVVDSYWSVFIPSLVSPFGVYLSRVYATSAVPDELLEAARLDGAGELRIFVTVSVRLMAPALVTIYLLQLVAIWNNFLLPLIMLQNTDLFPLTLGLYSWNSQVLDAPQLQLFAIVGSLVSIVPLIVAFLSLQRFWRSGLAGHAVT